VRERNPDLPILDELGAELAAMVAAAQAVEAGRHTARRRAPLPPPPRRRERRAQARRVGGRTAIVLVLVCLVGGVAFAALHGSGDDSGNAHTAPTQLGRAADGAWSFSAYRDKGRLCALFMPRGGELSGSCGAAPGPGRVRVGSAIAGGRRYVFGIAGAGVERVAASLGELAAARDGHHRQAAEGPARAPVDRGAAGEAGFPAGAGWFVLDLGPAHDAGGAAAPAIVTPLTRRGRRAGPPYVDCSLGVIGPACRRRIEAAAAGH
jgi:hypothetical protein